MALRATHPCFCAYNRTMDLKTPRNVKLSAFFRRSFAFRTVRDRLPIILTKTIDTLVQNKDEIVKECGTEVREDIKTVIGKLSRLKYEIQTNKPLKIFKSHADDAAIYNEYIRERDGMDGKPTPFHSIWLLVECYMYRKIREAIEKTKFMKTFDPFLKDKQELFNSSLPQIKEMLGFLKEIARAPVASKDDFSLLLQVTLWSNTSDLSLHPDGVIERVVSNHMGELYDRILVDDSEKIWSALLSSEAESIDIVLDNAGYELLSDFCLAHFLINFKFAKHVNFHVKNIPWFVSDVMEHDIKWMLNRLVQDEDETVSQFGKIWTSNFENNNWEIKKSYFWTLPFDFEAMHKYDKKLYEHLSRSKLIIFKGDLNYRKLFRDTFWNPTTPVEEAQGNFAPSKLCTLRTCKAEIICGLPEGLAEKYDEEDPMWMEIGKYGVIQFSEKIVPVQNDDVENSSE